MGYSGKGIVTVEKEVPAWSSEWLKWVGDGHEGEAVKLSIRKRGRTGDMRMERKSVLRVPCHATKYCGEFPAIAVAEGHI